MAILTLSLVRAWGKPTVTLKHIPQPSSTFTIGPGTVLSVHAVDLAFVGRYYTVRYKTEAGELIEIRHPGKDVPVLQGMHGLLTYSTNPEKILSFTVIEVSATK